MGYHQEPVTVKVVLDLQNYATKNKNMMQALIHMI